MLLQEMLAEMDYNTAIMEAENKGIQEGIQEGIQKGLQEGRQEGRLNTIKSFLSNGGTEEDARKYFQATDEEIQSAKNLS